MISAIQPDFSREQKKWYQWNPGKSLIKSIRRYQRYTNSKNPLKKIVKFLIIFEYRFWTAITGADIPLNCKIGGGLLIPHPNGIVIHPDAIIGVNCLIFQQVTIGIRRKSGAPKIGGNVDIGAGPKILGDIHIGNSALIGANSVVLRNVPNKTTALGVPARIIKRR